MLFFDPFRDFTPSAQSLATRPLAVNGRRPWMPMDAYRTGDQVVLRLDLPGIDPASLDVTVDQGTLTIKAERHSDTGEGNQVLVSERPQGAFTRRLRLSDALDGDRAEAHYDNGVLTVTVPVAEQAKPHRVEISTGSQPEADSSEPVAA
jgi:HSP20 family protein